MVSNISCFLPLGNWSNLTNILKMGLKNSILLMTWCDPWKLRKSVPIRLMNIPFLTPSHTSHIMIPCGAGWPIYQGHIHKDRPSASFSTMKRFKLSLQKGFQLHVERYKWNQFPPFQVPNLPFWWRVIVIDPRSMLMGPNSFETLGELVVFFVTPWSTWCISWV